MKTLFVKSLVMKSLKIIHVRIGATLAILLSLCATRAVLAQQSAADAVHQAEQALSAKQYDRAIAAYEKARDLMPQNAAIAYNLGVAQFRKGEFENAADSFKQAMSLAQDPSLRSQSIYNMGTSAYAQSLKALQEKGDPSKPSEQLNQATDLLKNALEDYKRAIDANPADQDAKANAELSHRLLKQLQEMQKQQQQQQQQQQQNKQNQDQQQQNQQQQQSSQQQNQQQKQDQDQQSQASQQQNSDQQQNAESQPQQSPQSQPEQDSSQQQDQQNNQDKQNPPQDQQKQNADEKQAATQPENADQQPRDQGEHVHHESADKKGMTKQEAERLLQLVRDKERKRRAELARRETAKYAPVDKDW